eukprot:Gb_35089 [translate_table: standard]
MLGDHPFQRIAVLPGLHSEFRCHKLHPRNTRTILPCKDNMKHCTQPQILLVLFCSENCI